jgi:hypothetical protein
MEISIGLFMRVRKACPNCRTSTDVVNATVTVLFPAADLSCYLSGTEDRPNCLRGGLAVCAGAVHKFSTTQCYQERRIRSVLWFRRSIIGVILWKSPGRSPNSYLRSYYLPP